ncbi:hypothetical protein GFB49_15455 [Epibacterium sp. SM1979]|uniref:Biosynthetic protein, Pnap_2097 family n=1 Tax=Tritonibacter litoralis TaxID=2662264 RepID=A0A843YG87_9RHOB|nr:Pnap_2097 family protein [Tritonibacter litoralis]MQQ09861.1 hypothetical protein [Tritonibacter litoralis]
MTIYSRETPAAIAQSQEILLGMAQLSVQGLSEDWWLKHLGDIHWQMIATAMGQEEPVFRDADGRLIYAAFCATHFEQCDPAAVALGGRLTVRSSLWQAGRSRLQSIHELWQGNSRVARLRMVSTFVTHGVAGVNKSVLRVPPAIVPVLPPAPDGFADEAAARARYLRGAHRAGQLGGQNLRRHQPQMDLDFNAVGLLYFPTFSRIAAEAEGAACAITTPIQSRVMIYLGNIEIGEGLQSTRLTPKDAPSTAAEIALTDDQGGLIAVCTVTRQA